VVKFVIIESPYAAPNNPHELQRNLEYVNAAMHDCFLRGEVPFASHQTYTQKGVLDDNVPEQRKQGIDAGFSVAHAMFLLSQLLPDQFSFTRAFYEDRGSSTGMKLGAQDALAQGQNVERRTLGPEWSKEKDPPFRPAGWAFPANGRKAHFFEQGGLRSLCGKWLFDGPRYPGTGAPHNDECAVCGAMRLGYMRKVA
jgi:hypothetical protein